MKFDIPYIPDRDYTHFIQRHRDRIDSVYFGLHQGHVLDSRLRFKQVDTESLAVQLNGLLVPHTYCLLNSRFVAPDLYFDPLFLNGLMENLEILMDRSILDGIIFCDAYLLNALSIHGGEALRELEAVPGINCMIDSMDKARAFLELVDQTVFKRPSKLVLDRSLNRNPKALEILVAQLKKEYPGLRLELLANEGCLYHCPFKLAHDAQISLTNTGLVRERGYEFNREMGCMKVLFNNPERLFKSPFIRPEDIDDYSHLVDTIKISGRTLGKDFLENTVTAYIQGSYGGNLLDILDAMRWMAGHYFVDNKKISKKDVNKLSNCTKECSQCDYCKKMLDSTTQNKSIQFNRYSRKNMSV
ncbi:putative protease [Desulforapulum autotrophicum HRM2]|uniref:Protease n=1 Tax=Desulforapulum autotrophicum (strain ATCC 43914 / DSM 3382 / VKM B-1955 / HRM2) TaxID=177437 RepID=C0QDE4_DESAH|nr:putative protease [Desulforapulum autotrophicum]ACN15208.1 putative protease [Desulforapulum autotrophicum HRM2]